MTGRQPDLPHAARDAADRGDVIDAIRILREATGLGLREAKAAIEAYTGGARASDPRDVGEIPLGAVAALHQGDFFEAVKLTRAATGLGLKGAKEALEGYLARHPTVEEQFRIAGGRTPTSSASRFAVMAAVVALVVAGGLLWLLAAN